MRLRKSLLVLTIGVILFSACAGPSTPTIPAEIPPVEPAPSASEKDEAATKEVTTPEYTPAGTMEIEKLLDIRSVASGYSIRRVLPSAFGLVAQLALLSNGDIAISDYNQGIHLLSGGNVITLVAQEGIQPAGDALQCDSGSIKAQANY